VVMDVPVGIALGLAAPGIIAMFPAANGFCFLPATPNLLAAVFIDRDRIPDCAGRLFNDLPKKGVPIKMHRNPPGLLEGMLSLTAPGSGDADTH